MMIITRDAHENWLKISRDSDSVGLEKAPGISSLVSVPGDSYHQVETAMFFLLYLKASLCRGEEESMFWDAADIYFIQ